MKMYYRYYYYNHIFIIDFVSCVCTEEAEPEEPEPASNAYGRRRSRAVLYQLSGHYKSDKPKTGKLKLNNVSFVLSLRLSLY